MSGQFLIREKYHNSRTSDDIDVKLGPVTKPDQRNKKNIKKIDDDAMLVKCDVIVIFRFMGKLEPYESRNPDT